MQTGMQWEREVCRQTNSDFIRKMLDRKESMQTHPDEDVARQEGRHADRKVDTETQALGRSL